MTTRNGYPETFGVLLAGGAATRLGGGDKALREIGGRSLLARAIDRVRPQCSALILNANGDAARFAAFELAVVPDDISGKPGPLGGILAALDHLATTAAAEWLLSVASDCPFLPCDLAERLHAARGRDEPIAVAQSGGQIHPVVALWHVSLRGDLYHALVGEGVRKAGAFVARHPHAIAEWPVTPFDPFFNVNTPEDLRTAAQIAERNRADL